ncbi:MAG: ABC transporter permease [Proteobacteria bacterium]|nr:ABC transporter permease [Pseudomonadota bacterium]
MKSIAGYTGRKTLEFINHLLDIFAFTFRLMELFITRPVEGRALIKKAVVEQIYFTAVQALPMIIPLALMVGSMLIIQFTKLSGDFDLGKVTVVLVVRELGPIITALLVILRSATAVTIEISAMTVFNEIEALEMSGVDPMRIVSFARFVGITTAVLCLFIVFDIVAIFGGYAIVWVATDVTMGSFLPLVAKAITPTDMVVGLLKALTFGVSITVISLYHGFNTKKIITMIPVSASKTAVESFFWIMVINIIISGVFYL